MKCKIHNVRFYKPETRAIYCMAFHAQDKKLVLSRSDASLEIWNTRDTPFLERTIASSTENFSIEGLAWCDDRLFSVGLHGLLIEYDLKQLCIKSRLVVTGEAAFCLDIANNKQIAIGTEQGYLNIFEVVEGEVLFKKFLDKQEGRILCLKYHHSGDYVVSGSLDNIRIWNVNSGQVIHRMTTGRSEARKPTIVWCLAVTQDFTIISGDSRGKLTFWDGEVGAHLESYQSHRADILALDISKDENSLYCAGIDPNITNYVRIKVKEGSYKWVKNVQRKIHDHDVRALALCNDKLYSGGIDGYLTCSYHPPKTLLKFPPILQNPCVYLAAKSRYVMLRYPKHIEIWTLGQIDGAKDQLTGLLSVKKNPQKVLLLQKTVNSDVEEDNREGIICSALSPDDNWILYSTRFGIKLYCFQCNGGNTPTVIPVDILEEHVTTPCINAVFTSKNHLITAPDVGGLNIFKLHNDNTAVSLIQTLDTQELHGPLTFLLTSSCGKYIIAADPQSNIWIWQLNKDKYNFYCKLPKYHSAPTALAIHPNTLNLVVAYADNNLIEYDVKKRQLTDFSRSLFKNLPNKWLSRSCPIRNITFDPRAEHIIIMHDDSNVIVIDKEKEVQAPDTKKQKVDGSQIFFRCIEKYKHLVHLSALSPDELVAVEINPLSLLESLPPCFVQNTFGKK